jgi:hypothetical protein
MRYSNGGMDTLSLELIKVSKIEKHQTKLLPSGSVPKNQTDNGKFIFWSHHGDFTYFAENKKTCSYIAPVKIDTTALGLLYTVIFKSGKTLHIEVESSESVFTNKVNITSRGFKEDISINLKTEPITDVFTADLDKNSYEELYLITTSAGSGSYGEVYAFISNKDIDIIQCSLTNMTEPETYLVGYMGHDSFYIENSLLIRKFPVYIKQDYNANPTGGTKKIEYTLKDNKFKILSNR